MQLGKHAPIRSQNEKVKEKTVNTERFHLKIHSI